jgi:hypothetical protein
MIVHDDAPVPASRPPVLAYDELPDGSDIQREYINGGVQIKIPGGDLPPAVRERLINQTKILAALVSLPILAAALLLGCFLFDLRRLDSSLGIVACILFGVIAWALVQLIWRLQFRAWSECIERFRRQSTVIFADSNRLLIESAGPLGESSYEIAIGDIQRIGIGLDDRWRHPWMALGLRFRFVNGPPIFILPGRDTSELKSITRSLRQFIGAD